MIVVDNPLARMRLWLRTSKADHMIETLKHGSHSSPKDGMCLMEAASFLAGERFSDHPRCVSPALGTFGRAVNDRMPDDATRALLLPLLPRLLNTAGDGKDQRRGFMCADWAVRTVAPKALDAAGLTEQAETLRSLPEVVDEQTALAARDAARAARTAARAAAAAVRAAYDATYAAYARAAYTTAAYDAAYAAAYDAAYDAAYAATYAAAYAAACAAAYAATYAATAAVYALSWPEVVEFFDRLIEGEWTCAWRSNARLTASRRTHASLSSSSGASRTWPPPPPPTPSPCRGPRWSSSSIA